MIAVLESGVDLQGTWHAYDGKVSGQAARQDHLQKSFPGCTLPL